MVEHARSALVSTPIVHSATPLDAGWCGTGGAAWSIALAQMLRMLPIDNSRVVHHDLVISVILSSDSFSAATLSALNTSTAD